MSIETEIDATDTDAADAEDADVAVESDVAAIAEELGEAIADMPAYQRFIEAKEKVEDHEEAQERIQEFEQLREEFMLARQTGEATREDLRELQDAQEALHDIPVMSEYLEAQSDLDLKLQELNEYISEPLAVDFGGKAGGCCED